ncbi:hypothetical protein L9F63_009631, partial [Diploptera punctata]
MTHTIKATYNKRYIPVIIRILNHSSCAVLPLLVEYPSIFHVFYDCTRDLSRYKQSTLCILYNPKQRNIELLRLWMICKPMPCHPAHTRFASIGPRRGRRIKNKPSLKNFKETHDTNEKKNRGVAILNPAQHSVIV